MMKLKMPARIGFTALVSLAVASALAYLNRWQLAVFSTLLPMPLTLLSVVLALIALGLRRRTKAQASGRLHSWSAPLLLLSLFLILQLVALPLARTFRDLEVRRAQAFVTALIPKLEDYKRQHTAYPESLAPLLTTDVALPPLLQLHSPPPLAYDNRGFYRPRETTYSFQFYVPDGFIGGFQYTYCCGAEGTWTVTD